MDFKRDEELLSFIEEASRTSKTKAEALTRILGFLSTKRGVTGFHATPSCDSKESLEDVKESFAGCLIDMLRSGAEGKFNDITDKEL